MAGPEVVDPNAPIPRKNWHLVGHDAAEAAFLASVESGRLHHAWLICGSRGIGKATLAYRMARHVLARPSAAHASRRSGPERLEIRAPSPEGAARRSRLRPDCRRAPMALV